MRRRWSVVLARTVRELQGVSCVDLDDGPTAKKEIAATRSFGRPITELVNLIKAVSEFAGRAAVKLRRQSSLANQVLCFAGTSPFREDRQYSGSITVPLRRRTVDTAALAAVTGMRAICRPGLNFAKAGVMLLDLQSDSQYQGELLMEDDGDNQEAASTRLMAAFDQPNQRYGKGTIQLASAGLAGEQRLCSMKQERRTTAYTTTWADMLVARA